MQIVHCDRCEHWTTGLYGIPNVETGVEDKYCGSCLPKECLDTVPEALKDKYDQFLIDVKEAEENPPPPVDTYDDEDDEDW